jgi:hypothetical protein
MKWTYHSAVGVNGSNALVGTRFQQLGADHLLDGKDDAILGTDADGGATVLDRLDRIFDLEVSTIGGEDGVEQIVARAYGRLRAVSATSVLSSAGYLDE